MTLAILRQTVLDYRSQLAKLRSERDATLQAPIDAKEAAALVDREIAQAQAKPLSAFDYLESGGFSASTFNRRADDVFSILAVVAPDKLKEAALASLPPSGLSRVERSRRLSEIESGLLVAAVAEELALRQIEAMTGSHERRRLDAEAAILLAPLSELQAAALAAKPGKRAA